MKKLYFILLLFTVSLTSLAQDEVVVAINEETVTKAQADSA